MDRRQRIALADATTIPRRIDAVGHLHPSRGRPRRLTEAETAGRGGRIAYLPMTEVDRAIAAGETDGFVTARSPLWPSC